MIKSAYIVKIGDVEIFTSFFSGIFTIASVFTKAFIDLFENGSQIIK